MKKLKFPLLVCALSLFMPMSALAGVSHFYTEFVNNKTDQTFTVMNMSTDCTAKEYTPVVYPSTTGKIYASGGACNYTWVQYKATDGWEIAINNTADQGTTFISNPGKPDEKRWKCAEEPGRHVCTVQ